MANRQVDGAVDVTGFDWLVPLRQRAPIDTVWPAGDTLAAGLGNATAGVSKCGGVACWSRRSGSAPSSTRSSPGDCGPRRATSPPDSLLVARAPDSSAVLYIRQVGLRDSAGVWRAEQLDGEVLVRRRN